MGYMNIPDVPDLYAGIERAQEFQAKQNAMAAQRKQDLQSQMLRNVLAQSIDPNTGQTNWRNALVSAPQQLLPQIQQARQADLLAQMDFMEKRNKAQKAGIDAETAYWTQQRDVASRIGDQASWSSWRSTLPAEFQQFVPEQYSPENQRMTLATADKALELHFQQVDTGAGGYTLSIPKMGGTATKVPGSEFTKTLSAAESERLDIDWKREQRLDRELAGGVVPPKLKPGERWNAQTQTVEAVPGSAEYIKQSQLHTKDRSSFTTIKEQRELADKKIDFLLSPKNADAFSNLFGGYTEKFISSKFSGATASAKTQLDSLKSNIKNAGLRLIQQGGKIGAITEREWPILEGMIAGLDPTMKEKDARETLDNIKAFFKRMESNAAEEYQSTWGNTQYYNPTLVGPSALVAPTATGPRKTKSGVTYTVEE